MILRSVTTYSASELAWVYRDGASRLLPERWDEFTAGVPADERDDLVAAYHRRVGSPDAGIRVAAARAKEIPAQENTFRRLYGNQWTEQASRWISMPMWDACCVVTA